MCGIVAMASLGAPIPRGWVTAMAESLNHRGPDGVRVWSSDDGKVALGHARLCIIDLEGGWQPMVDEASGCVLSFNGEIYNFRELRAELEAAGARFTTRSDSEVLLRSYLHWGHGCLARLNGMFAFAIYDPRSGEVLLARDPMGIKPLYYAADDGSLIAASELRTIAAFRERGPELDPAGLSQYCTIGYTIAPQTLITDVRQLPHGHWAIWKRGGLAVQRYFDLAEAVNARHGERLSYTDCIEQLDALCQAAVKRQLFADVKVGTFLSSGVDSTLVSTLVSRLAGDRLATFTGDFDEAGYSELDQAKRTARSLGLENTAFRVSVSELIDRWAEMAWATDAPLFDPSFLPVSVLCRSARSEVAVALSGDGGDELFLGYETYRADWLARRTRWLAALTGGLVPALADRWGVRFGKVTTGYKLRAFARAFTRPAALAHCGWREIASRRTLAQLLQPQLADVVDDADPGHHFTAAFERAEGGDLLTRFSYVDCETWLPNDILVKADRASMAYGLEVRVPLLDVHLARFAMGLPDASKFRLRRPKALLKDLLARLLPSYPGNVPKLGFLPPISEWLAGPLSPALDGLSTAESMLHGYLRPQCLTQLVAAHRERRDDHGLLLWSLLVLDRWWNSLLQQRRARAGVPWQQATASRVRAADFGPGDREEAIGSA